MSDQSPTATVTETPVTASSSPAPAAAPKVSNDAIYVAYVEGQGRGVFASRDIAAGEVVYQEEPYVMVPLITKHGDQTCLHCVKQFPRPSALDVVAQLQCDRCHEFYCSPECRAAYEGSHCDSGECTALYRTLPAKGDLSTDDYNNLRGIAAMAMKCKKEGKERYLDEKRPKRALVRGKEGVELVLPKFAVREPEKMDLAKPATDFTVVASLTTNLSLFDEDRMDTFRLGFEAYEQCYEEQSESDDDEEEEEEEDEDSAQTTKASGETEGDASAPNMAADAPSTTASLPPKPTIPKRLTKLPYMSDYMFDKITCAYQCNGFSIWNQHKKESSSGVYGFAAMINHSCVPNIAKTFTIKTLNFTAKTAIKKGDQLFISYVDTTLSSNFRQWRLSHQYFIDECYCPKCRGGR